MFEDKIEALNKQPNATDDSSCLEKRVYTVEEIMEILRTALYEFPVLDIKVSIPEWVHVLPNNNEIKQHYM